jgi:hypothetical protein
MKMANHRLDYRRIGLVCAALAATAVLASGALAAGEAVSPPLLLAQFDSGPAASPAPAGGFKWEMPVKIGAVVAVALVACMVCYFVIYPTILRSGRVLPVTLFGRMSALAWLITCITALAVLWDNLVWADEFGATNFWREHGGRIAVLAVGIGFAFVWMYLWRSEAPQKSTATQLAK